MAGDGKSAWIHGIGMMTPVGDCAAQTATSVRAGICRYQESPIYNKSFVPMTLALLPDESLPPLKEELESIASLTSRQIRMLRLATGALTECLRSLPERAMPPLFLAAPEPLPDRPPAVDDTFLDQLLAQTGAAIDRDASALFPAGRAAGIEAVNAAREAIAQGADLVVVGGVDSCLDLYTLSSLDRAGRVLAEGVMDGFAPGEAACFLLLGSDLASGEDQPGVEVHLPGLATEPAHRYSDEPYKGDGLAEAIRLAIEKGESPIRTVLCSLNGESFGAKEWGIAALRNQPAFIDDVRCEHPAECFGDVGAAIGPLLIGLAALGMRKGYYAGPCLVWCSSDSEQRGAVCVTRAGSKEG